MCDHWKEMSKSDLNTDQWKNIIDQIADWGIKEVDLSGGEPMTRKDIFEIIDYLTEKNIKINVTTNFTLLQNNQIEALFDTTLNRLQVSLDGVGSVHDDMRGKPGTFDKVMENISYFNKVKKDRNSSILLCGTTVITNKNIHQLVDIYHLAKEISLSYITYQPVYSSNKHVRSRNGNKHLMPNASETVLFENKINELIEIRKQDGFICNAVEHFELIKEHFRNEPFDYVKCYTGFLYGIIGNNGSMWNCMGKYADLTQETIKQAWYSNNAARKRKAMKKCKTLCFLNRVAMIGFKNY
jgi:MoaA/NifB/PqqE/SkfB family radical SAM enzyme